MSLGGRETFDRIVHVPRSDETLSQQPIFWLFTVAQRWGVLCPLEVQRGHRSGSGIRTMNSSPYLRLSRCEGGRW